MKKLSVALFSFFTFGSLAHADLIGGELDLGLFGYTPSGTVGSSSGRGSSQNIEENEDANLIAKLYIEQPVPMIPNLKLGYTNLTHDTSYELDMTDVTLYYQLIDTVADVDFGITARNLSGKIYSAENIDKWKPMLYGKAGIGLPMSGLGMQFELGYNISDDNDVIYDMEFGVRYTFAMGMGAEVGYRSFHLETDNLTKSFKTDLDFQGLFANFVLDF